MEPNRHVASRRGSAGGSWVRGPAMRARCAALAGGRLPETACPLLHRLDMQINSTAWRWMWMG